MTSRIPSSFEKLEFEDRLKRLRDLKRPHYRIEELEVI